MLRTSQNSILSDAPNLNSVHFVDDLSAAVWSRAFSLTSLGKGLVIAGLSLGWRLGAQAQPLKLSEILVLATNTLKEWMQTEAYGQLPFSACLCRMPGTHLQD